MNCRFLVVKGGRRFSQLETGRGAPSNLMQNPDLIDVLHTLEENITECELFGTRQQKYLASVREMRHSFEDLIIAKKFKEVYDSLVAKGNKLNSLFSASADAKDLSNKLNYYLNYLNAAYGDFTGQTQNITVFYRMFLLCSILFLALSPMFLTPIFSIIFIIPIVLAMKGVKQRVKNGYWLAMLVAPISFMTSIMWIRHGIYIVSGNFSSAVSAIMTSAACGETLATVLTIVCPILGSALFVLAVLLLIQGNKVKKLFV